MTEIPTCPTCRHRPSERIAFDRSGYGCTYCCDPIHDLADQGPAAVALLRDVVFEMAELRHRHRVLTPWTLGERIDTLLAATLEVKP